MGPEPAGDSNPVQDALLAWTSWPGYIKETLDPVAVAAAIARRSKAAAARSSSPTAAPSTDPKYVLLISVHDNRGNTAGEIHSIDPSNRSPTLCGRYYRGFNGSTRILSSCPFPSENVAIEGALRCSSCTRCEEQCSL